MFWGLARRELENIEAIGVDEISWTSGNSYLTMVSSFDGNVKRLLWIAPRKTKKSLRGFFVFLSEKTPKGIQLVASDMGKKYLKGIAEQAPNAVNVLNRFHVMKNMNTAIDEVRRAEVAELKRDGNEQILKHLWWRGRLILYAGISSTSRM